MKHLMNRRSKLYICKVRYPQITKNTTDVGTLLNGYEPTCESCARYWHLYWNMIKEAPLSHKLVEEK